MKKIILSFILFVVIAYANHFYTKVSAGYNSEGDKVYLDIHQSLIAYLAAHGVNKKVVAKHWLKYCSPSNIFRGKVVDSKTNDDSVRLYINYEWRIFGSGSNEMLIIFEDHSYELRCID